MDWQLLLLSLIVSGGFCAFAPTCALSFAAEPSVSKSWVMQRELGRRLKQQCQKCIYTINFSSGEFQVSLDQFSQIPSNAWRGGNFDIYDSDKKRVRISIKAEKPIPVVAQLIKSGEEINRNNTKIEIRELAQTIQFVESVEELKDKVAQRDLLPHQMLRLGDISKRIDVKSGQMVSVYSLVGPLHVEGELQALESGSTGERIRMRPFGYSPQSQVSYGVVESQGRVRLD